MRPTGRLHLGHLSGVLSEWLRLQEECQCFFMVADLHALMSEYKNSSSLKEIIYDNLADWLSWGISPEKAVVFVQSDVPEHMELFITLSLITPLGWLYRCPSFKEQIQQLKSKEINTYAFLGYPLLQTADIIIYKAEKVPVGQDQLPHLELAREVVRRFHTLYGCNIFPQPQPIVSKAPKLLGVDGRKMSNSYNNCIYLSEDDAGIKEKIGQMVTDPQRIHRTDIGHPEVCSVFNYYSVFFPQKRQEVEEWCRNAARGCRECKRILAELFQEKFFQVRKLKARLLKDKAYLEDILSKGSARARKVAAETMQEVNKILGYKL